jgi:hypothetical protein
MHTLIVVDECGQQRFHFESIRTAAMAAQSMCENDPSIMQLWIETVDGKWASLRDVIPSLTRRLAPLPAVAYGRLS